MTTIIKTHKVELQSSWLVAFIYPEAKKNTKKSYVPVDTEFDIERQLQFLHRKYIHDKLIAWLKQRSVARTDSEQTIRNLSYAVSRLEKVPLRELAKYVNMRRASFEGLAPTKDTSPCLGYYNKIILPILDFCKQVENI